MKRKVLALILAVTMFAGMSITSYANGNATVSFTADKKLEYSNVTPGENGTVNLGSAFENVAPGETKSQTITLFNENERTADFYMSTEVLDSLEKGKDAAKGAGYDIILSIKHNAEETVLYDSAVGGYKVTDSEETASATGIDAMNTTLGKDANNDKEADHILVATLPKGDTADVVLSIAFDGEAMDNNAQGVDYSLTDGQIAFDFKVAYEEPSGEVIIREVSEDGEVTYIKKVVNIIENAVPLGAVATGDGAMLGLAVLVLAAGACLVVFGRKRKVEE